MPIVPDAAKKVPLMFRSQINGRCQLQRLIKNQESDALLWADEWVDKAYPDVPEFGAEVKTRSYSLSWRFVTNGGQDDGIIRPVIGAKGWPFYPGSSMKGIFRRACTPQQAERYCGKSLAGGDYEPGILRFHGGYPTDDSWTENLVDIVHPQQDWQVKDERKDSGAFVQISLYKPKIKFGISSTIDLEGAEWETIWDIWKKALSTGIGCRVCAGYGQPKNHTGDVLYRTLLKGQGQAAKLIDGTGEFRPNIFRAALRGHALRIFGGMTDEQTANYLVEELFGSVQGQGTVGLLGMSFQDSSLKLDTFGKGSYEQPTYEVEGELIWLLTQKLPNSDQHEALKKLVAALTRFAVLLGGFGKSWRRADHRLFFPEYYEGKDGDRKPLIGCHWQWLGERSLRADVRVRNLESVGSFIDEVRQTATAWMQLRGVNLNPNQRTPWREAWHPENVQVWGSLASEAEDCEAIRWLHGSYREAIYSARITEGSIYRSSVTGQVGQIGRIWHRMYPLVRLVRERNQSDAKPIPKATRQYFELLTFFPDNSPESSDLLNFLQFEQHEFQHLWPGLINK
jgi:CRISPR-associated protein Cmr6